MGATNTTANYSLSQFIGTDKPAWLQDYNGDMLKIDTGINAAKVAADGAQNSASAAQNDATTANNAITNTINPAISSLNTTVGNQGGAINTINSLIGNGTPTTTDQTIIGAINEINAELNYSTSETVCGKWIDNSDIYRKCYVIDQDIPANTYTSITSQPGITNLKDVISIRSQFRQGSTWITGTREVNSDISRGMWVQVDSSTVSGGLINTSAVNRIIIIVEYTKTT